jgi:hypothetical protein
MQQISIGKALSPVFAEVAALPGYSRKASLQNPIVLKSWRESMLVHRTTFANLSKYRPSVASVVFPRARSAT